MNTQKLFACFITVSVLLLTPSMSFAQGNYNPNVHQVTVQKHHYLSPGTKALLKDAAFGAGAGFVLSGSHNRGTNILKGAALGAGIPIILRHIF